jgi:hypothetical protein
MQRNFSVRLDAAKLGLDGFLRVKARIARTGCQEYMDNGELVYEYRSPDEVKASMGSLDQLGIIIDHKAMIDSGNKDTLVKGLTSNVRFEETDRVTGDGWVVADICVFASDAITAALTSHTELSCGYDCEVVPETGVWTDKEGSLGEKGKSYEYTYTQKDILGNHLALVPMARAGRKATFFDSQSVKARFDSDNISVNNNHTDATNGVLNKNMAHNDKGAASHSKNEGNNLGGEAEDKAIEMEIETEDMQEFDMYECDLGTFPITKDGFGEMMAKFKAYKEKAKNAGSVANTKGKKGDSVDALQAKLDAKDAQIEALTEQLDSRMDSNQIGSEITARLALWAIAKPLLKVDSIDANLSQREIKQAILKVVYPKLDAKIADGNEIYVNTLWDIYEDSKPVEGTKADTQADKVDAVLEDIQASTTKTTLDSIQTAQQAYMDRILKNSQTINH